MDVASTDQITLRAANTIVPAGANSNRLGLILGLPGFGKTSLLTAAAGTAARLLGGRVVWISGSIVASERHLLGVLPRELLELVGEDEDVARHVSDNNQRPCVLAIDDIDALVFKRDGIADLLTELLTRQRNLRLLVSSHPSAAQRFVSASGWLRRLANDIGSPIESVSIALLDHESAHSLIRRREPELSNEIAERIIAATGGHPAALVFLSRLARLYDSSARDGVATRSRSVRLPAKPQPTQRELADLVVWAGEFAGAVYAESWAALGPQQRAILWQLARSDSPKSASEIATTIKLTASHVSAQLSRLVVDGLVQRVKSRGQFSVSPLLASWIGRRATRDKIDASSEKLRGSDRRASAGIHSRPSQRTRSSQRKRNGSANRTGAKNGRPTGLQSQPRPAARKNGPPLR